MLDKKYYFPHVLQAIATEDYKVYAYFDDGTIKCVDMKNKLDKGIFLQLKDIKLFKSALTVLNGTVAWDVEGDRDTYKCIDLDPFTLYELPTVKESDFINQINQINQIN